MIWRKDAGAGDGACHTCRSARRKEADEDGTHDGAADGEWAPTQDAGDAGGSIIEHVVMEPTVEAARMAEPMGQEGLCLEMEESTKENPRMMQDIERENAIQQVEMAELPISATF